MKLPKLISESLSADPSLNSIVNGAIAACQPIVSCKPDFFPEYTDHSTKHNEDVLTTALDFLTNEAITRLTSRDFSVLTLSVLLHDCGMHLTADAFQELVSPNNKSMTALDRVSWATLWSDFILEAKRFDGRQLKSLFGSTDPIHVPAADPSDYTKRDRLLIGEFLRRHHPRLAHEISLFGFPALDGARIQIIDPKIGDLAEISGLVARSHGMPLRSAVDIFRDQFHEREYQDIHPPILMAALRIADYVQIQPERAPFSHTQLHRLSSPYSQSEWKVHQSIRNITKADSDPEAIYVDARPDTVGTFLKFKKWAKDFQSELDSTWASLGEVYGRFNAEGLDKLQLRLRRLRTSVDDEDTFANSVTYVPARIAFEASSPNLLSLLIAPLYGNRPEIGLRELIQNSIDAVSERRFVEGKAPTEFVDHYDADVVVRPIMHGRRLDKILVADRGIGMDVDTIRAYFLRAGASFRSSSYWKKAFLNEEGKSKVARTGRFGVGALAGFLLGPSMIVRTRRFDSDTGLIFVADLETDAIEMRRCECPVGTHITVSVDDENRNIIESLFSSTKSNTVRNWDWYCNTYPSLLRINRSGKEITSDFYYHASEEWVPVSIDGYEDVRWSGANAVRHLRDSATFGCLYCNGIYVGPSYGYSQDRCNVIDDRQLSSSIFIHPPAVLITDYDGRLPINLQRNGLSATDSELSTALKRSMANDLIAEYIAKSPEEDPFRQNVFDYLNSRKLSCLLNRYGVSGAGPVDAPHWCWEDDCWRISDIGLATKKPWLLAIHGNFDLSKLSRVRAALADTTIVWQRSGASSTNTDLCVRFFRNLVQNFFWDRGVVDGANAYPAPFCTFFPIECGKN